MLTNEELREGFIRKFGSKPVTILGTVVEVHEPDNTCDLDDDGLLMCGVRLQSITDSKAGILKIPKVGAVAIAVKIEDDDGFMLLDSSEYDSIVLNGGENGGLVIVGNLVEKINAIEKQVEAFKSIFKQWVPVYESALKTSITTSADLMSSLKTTIEDLENTSITH